MNQSEIVNDWPSDDASEAQVSDFSTSDSEVSQPAASAFRSRLRPAGGALTFVPFADWEPERSYEGEPTIRYNMEWKLFAKNRSQAGETELNIVVSPRKFWKYVLQPKLTDACAGNPWKEDKTKLVLSVTDRKTSKIIKEFPKLDVKWSFVAKQLREWSLFLNEGKKISITVTFYYRAVNPGKSERGSATANQQADLEARTTGVGRGACIRKAYTLMRCPGPPCTKGDHCWQNEGKHHRLQPHHIRILADHLQAGKVLNGHDDVPPEFRRLVKDDERQWEEREQAEREKMQGRKRQRRDSGGSAVRITQVHCHQCATGIPPSPKTSFPITPLLKFDLPREETVVAYSIWQRSQVSTEEQKEHYMSAQELTLAHCFDLDMLASNQEKMFRFYKKHGIPEGVAWRYVCDVRSYIKRREETNNPRC
ncbi:Fc.00g055600.m01.CDS01 [Cosmosporella sp. VM-42]